MSLSAHLDDVAFSDPLPRQLVRSLGGNDEITEQHCSRAFPVRMVVCDVDDPLPEFEAWWTGNPSATRHDNVSPVDDPTDRARPSCFRSAEPKELIGAVYGSPAYTVLREIPDPVAAGIV